MRPRSALLLLTALHVGTPGGAAAQDPEAAPVNTHGLPGLVVTPVPGALPVGRLFVGANDFPDFQAFWSSPSRTLGRQDNGSLSFALWSRVTVAVGVSELRPEGPRGTWTGQGPDGPWAIPLHSIDLSANAQLTLWDERTWRPQLALGAYDVAGNGLIATRYLVASKRLGSRVHLSAGYGTGEVLSGVFGGARLLPTRWSTLVAEWDGHRLNAGIGVRPILPGGLGRFVVRPELRALWAEDRGWYGSVALGLPWDMDAVPVSPDAPTPAAPAVIPSWTTAEELAGVLAELGFENVQAAISDTLIRVRYDDRVHLQSRLDGLGRVLDVVAAGAERTQGARVTLLAWERPVLDVEADPATLTSIADGAGRRLLPEGPRFRYPEGAGTSGTGWTRPLRPSRLRADLVLRPRLENHLAWEGGMADARFAVLPTLEVPLAAGFNAAVGAALPVWQTDNYEITRGPLPDPSLAVALVGYLWSRPISPEALFAAHWSGGRFDVDREGFRQELALLLDGGRLRLDADLAATRAVRESSRSVTAVVGARWLLPDATTRLEVTAGHYLFRDVGVTGRVSRDFGDTRVAIGLRHSEHGSQGTFAVSLPFTGERTRAPGRVRVRVPSAWGLTQTIRLFYGDDGGWVSSIIAERLPLRFEAWERFSDRDRLHPFVVERTLSDPRYGRRW